MAARDVWQHFRDILEGQYRWSKVRGPMSSAIATLWDWGFEPLQLDSWMDPDGMLWNLDFPQPSLIAGVKEVLKHHFKKRVWQNARSWARL